MASSGYLLLDNVDTYLYNSPGKWYAYVNDVYKDGFVDAADGINVLEVFHGDTVEFYYAEGIADPADLATVQTAATAAVKTVVFTGVAPTDWTLQLSGATDASVTKTYFEEGLACPGSGHYVEWTDSDNNTWGGVPLWLLVGMVDDDPDVGPYHFNFNDNLASQNYEVNVIAGDGWSATLDSATIARNDGYIVANTLNGEPLPLETDSGKPCWPLYLKGSEVFGGQQVGNIVRIELSGLPEPPAGWTLEMVGEVGDIITQTEFEAGLACPDSNHYVEWTDIDGNVWSGVPLWVLLGAVDDIETGSHWTFNDGVAAAGYTINVIAGDGYTRTFDIVDVARSSDYIIADKINGLPLDVDSWPLRLVGDGVTRSDGSLGGSAVGNIVKIEIPELQTPPADPGSWNLALNGKITDVISQAEFEAALACPDASHYVEWTDIDGNIWSGMPLWFLTGWVDDRQPHDYNVNQAMAGYTVLVKAGDGYTKDFASADIAWSNDYIVANQLNGVPLDDSWPLRLVGDGVTRADGSLSGKSVGNIVEIELTDFQTVMPIPQLHIIKYDTDRTTILSEITVDYLWMQENLDVIGDGTVVYKFEGITNDPDDIWDAAETYPGGYKIENAVKGTRIKDLCDLVGGMGAGTEIKLIASDGYETTLPYASIYTDTAIQARQGDAILAWWSDGEYVPYYSDGMRLFFTPDGDHVYGQWDMHETLPLNYWHYYYDSSAGVMYPSCAGLSAKFITTIEIHSVPESNWTLELDGQDIGGLYYEVTKTYFEQALACQFGANHKATYTDSKGREWEGMPLWFLVGFVDDADQHSDNAFNDSLALAGYEVVITAADGYSVTISSQDVIRNSDYIVANSLNGAHIPDTDGNWPLRLVGPAVSGSLSISQIVSIELKSIAPPIPPSGGFGGAIPNPASISVAGLSVSPEEIYIGEGAVISVLLVNSGDLAGTYEAILKINRVITETQVVEVAGNDSATVIFYIVGQASGTYQIAVGEGSGILVVLEIPEEPTPASFNVSSMEISADEIDVGEEITITIMVDNAGETEGVYKVVCKINGVVVDEKEITLAGGSKEPVVFTLSMDEAGSKIIEVNGLTIGLVVREVEEELVQEPEQEGTIAEIPPEESQEEPESPEPQLPEKSSPATSWWLIIIYVIAGIIVVSVIIYFFIRKPGTKEVS
jgi:DMSO/TMAO reductase YedYZ molybdopterin-dependent catalytic subunit